MIETVAIWIAGKTGGALVKPVLTKLAGDIANDIAKDKGKGFVNKMLRQTTKLLPHDELIKAYSKAIAELVQTIDENLCNAGVPEHQTQAWLKARATQDDDWRVRRAAVRELARGWKDDPAIQAFWQAWKTRRRRQILRRKRRWSFSMMR